MEKAMDRHRKNRWGGSVEYLSRIYNSNELARALFQRAFCLRVRVLPLGFVSWDISL